MNNAFGIVTQTDYFIPMNIFGVVVVGLLVMIIFGGVKRLGHASETIVPLMAGAYILVGLIIIILSFHRIPEVFSTIISSAFGQDAVFGGILGSAIAWGVKRGIYSNEAGQGTGPHAAAASEVIHPAEQGVVQAFSVYLDTLFVCTTTAFMILFTNQYHVMDEQTKMMVVEHIKDVDYTGFTQAAISSHFPSFGNEFVAVALFFFAYNRHESAAHLPNRHAQAVDDVLTLKISADGHFRTPGTINGEAVIFMLDTGASGVALSDNLARRIGLRPRGHSRVSTANGVTDAGLVTLDELGFGGWQFERVPATVMPQMEDEVLLGMQILRHFEWKQSGGELRLQPTP